MVEPLLDRFAAWVVGLSFTWWLAERGFKPAHLLPLCIAHGVGLSVRWHHLTGRVGIMDVYPGELAPSEDRQHV